MIEDELMPATEPERSDFRLDSIFEVTSYATRPPVELPFRPWHKPRKQAVREEQWGREIEWLLNRKPEGDKTLRYLGLPGPDLLDIRYLYERFCSDGSHDLTFLGFDKSALKDSPFRDSLNISLREVRGLEHVNGQSDIIGDDFRLLSNSRSIAWDRATKLGPFDAINIDFCDNIAADKPTISLSTYNAIHGICGLQQRRTHPWTLFLTSRITRNGFSAEAVMKLLEAIQNNLTDCPAFASELGDAFGIIEASPATAATWDEGNFFAGMTIAISKWLLGLAVEMRSKFTISSTIGYRVYGKSQYFDMLSIVLRFEPVNSIPADFRGLASADPVLPSECAQAAKLPRRVLKIRDIDQELDSNPELRESFVDKAADLLQQARYNPDAYRRWAADGQASASNLPGLSHLLLATYMHAGPSKQRLRPHRFRAATLSATIGRVHNRTSRRSASQRQAPPHDLVLQRAVLWPIGLADPRADHRYGAPARL